MRTHSDLQPCRSDLCSPFRPLLPGRSWSLDRRGDRPISRLLAARSRPTRGSAPAASRTGRSSWQPRSSRRCRRRQAAEDPLGDQPRPYVGARCGRVQAVGLHQLRVGGDEARPVGHLRPRPRGGEFGDDPVLAGVVDAVDGVAVDRRHDHAAVADGRRDLGQVSGEDLGIGRVVVGAGVEDDHRLRRGRSFPGRGRRSGSCWSRRRR